MQNKEDARHNARRLALSSLFCGLNKKECLDLSEELLDLKNSDYDVTLSNSIINGIKKNGKTIDTVISECAPDWPIDKISKVDLIIMRIAVFELMFGDKIPELVVVDEAVELAKEFGNDSSSKFVNGVLGTVIKINTEVKEEK